ncbi:MAG: DUF4445 domain-containing protein [Archaeoglobi archaeon]|nr:DUF4445 domain-containing protein [Candidatus Mnemosynella sp.]
MNEFIFEPSGKRIRSDEENVLEAAREAGVEIRADCGGRGGCGKCRIQIIELRGDVNEPTEKEREKLSLKELETGYRLACQLRASGRLRVFIPPESRIESRRISESTIEEDVELLPAVRKIHVRVREPSLEDQLADVERLKREIGDFKISLQLLRRLPFLLRESKWDITAVLWRDELLSVEKGDTSKSSYGLAFDIGSSKLICHLVDLNTGRTLSRKFSENPQVAYGEDIVSRITYASRSEENLRRLQRIVIEELNELIEESCREAGVELKEIYEAVIVGNSVMHHIFFGIPPNFIGSSPFTPAVRDFISYPAMEIGLRMNEEGRVTSLPLIAGFVGADAVSNMLSTRIYRKNEISMVIDIGTNTEILLGNSERILVCSAPSGPAFEGAHIAHGMKAVSGAIERVRINGDEIEYETIDGERPKGICGSGMIDLIAELYEKGWINRNGKIVREDKAVLKDSLRCITVVPAEESWSGKEIYVSEKDISEFLMAKGAIKAGWMTLAEKLEISPEEIEKIYLAGSFGRHVDLENAKIIGLLPQVENRRVIFAGDSAIAGAKMVLKSIKERDEVRKALEKVEYVELSAERDFYRIFVKAIYL